MAERRWWEAVWNGLRRKPPATNQQIIRANRFGQVIHGSGGPGEVAERPTPTINIEHGVSGTEVQFGGVVDADEYLPELSGAAGLKMYDKMRRSDAQVRASLQIIKLPLQAAVWQAVPPENGDGIDQAVADFVNSSVVDDDALADSWQFVLRHILLQLDFGFSVMEKVWRVDEQHYFRLKRLAPRLPRTIYAFDQARDGTIVRLWQYAPVNNAVPDPIPQGNGNGSGYGSSLYRTATAPRPPVVTYQYLAIPGECACVFTHEREGDNHQGISLLRSAYRSWFYKDLIYHLDGVRLDRYGVGVPVAELSPEHTLDDTDLEDLAETLQDLRSNERVWMIAPPGVRYRIMAPEGGGGASASAQSLVEHHDTMIARNVLASFMTMGQDQHGTLGFGSRLTDLFISSLYGVSAAITADLKRTVVKPLCDLNFDMTNREYPSVVVRDLESENIEAMMKVLLQGVQGTMITPDDDLEAMLRKTLKLPPLPEEQSRAKKGAAAAPGAPGEQVNGQVNGQAAGVPQGPVPDIPTE
jgi:hypothetical protein